MKHSHVQTDSEDVLCLNMILDLIDQGCHEVGRSSLYELVLLPGRQETMGEPKVLIVYSSHSVND